MQDPHQKLKLIFNDINYIQNEKKVQPRTQHILTLQ